MMKRKQPKMTEICYGQILWGSKEKGILLVDCIEPNRLMLVWEIKGEVIENIKFKYNLYELAFNCYAVAKYEHEENGKSIIESIQEVNKFLKHMEDNNCIKELSQSSSDE